MNRAFIDTKSAIDAGVWVNVELACLTKVAFVLAWVDAIHWADFDTGGVLRSDAGFSDNVCHMFFPNPPRAAGVRILARQRSTGTVWSKDRKHGVLKWKSGSKKPETQDQIQVTNK
jgi:hypothetical protein